jgi:hypothetical protein
MLTRVSYLVSVPSQSDSTQQRCEVIMLYRLEVRNTGSEVWKELATSPNLGEMEALRATIYHHINATRNRIAIANRRTRNGERRTLPKRFPVAARVVPVNPS